MKLLSRPAAAEMDLFGHSQDGKIYLYALSDHKPHSLPQLAKNRGDVTAVSFSPDGKGLLLPHDGGDILLDLDVEQWRDAACARAGRALTQTEWSTYFPVSADDRPAC